MPQTNIFAWALVVVLMATLVPQSTTRSAFSLVSLCRPCYLSECDIKPQGCRYGTTRNPCRQLVCASGTGERCGGPENHLGKCGQGMICRCGYCRGCSTVRFLLGEVDCQWRKDLCNFD